MKIWKKALALLTALLLLPCAGLADAGVQFDLRFDASAEGDLVPVADVLNLLAVSGRYGGEVLVYARPFILDAELTLEDSPRTRTTFSLYGNNSVMGMESSLFGDAVLMLNMRGVMEFVAKLYNHMGLSLDRAALLYPGSTLHALRGSYKLCQAAGLDVGLGTHTVSQEALVELAGQLSELTQADMSLFYWLEALGSRSGMDEVLFGLFDQLPDYAEELPESGLEVRADGSTETWLLGERTVLTANETAFSMDLDDLPDGMSFSLHWSVTDGALDLTCDLAQYDEVLLHAQVTGTVPTALPVDGSFALTAALSGLLADELSCAASISGQGDGKGGLMVTFGVDDLSLTARGTLLPADVGPVLRQSETWITENGLNVFAMNDITMNQIASQIAKPMVKGLLPLIAHAPASACAMVMDVLDDAGIFGLVASGNISMGGGEDDESDWENWSGGDDEELDPSIYEGYDEDDWDFSGSSNSASDGYDEDDWDFSPAATDSSASQEDGDYYDADDWDFSEETDAEYEEDDWDF